MARANILWRNTTGDNFVWVMNGAAVLSVTSLGNVPTNWTVQNINANYPIVPQTQGSL